MDSLLLFTVLTIFLTAFVGTIIRYRIRDKCLKGFRDYFVTLELQDGKRVWGTLDIYHNALELVYPSAHIDTEGLHLETSFILYQDQFKNITTLRRLHDELTPENRSRREKELEQTYHPGFFRRGARRVRNGFNLLRDAFAQATTAFIGQVKKTGTSSYVASQDARLSSTAQQLITHGAAAYEPILEKYIGRKVVLEVQREKEVTEYCGVLRDYTDQFISVLNVPVAEEHDFNLADPRQLEVNASLDFEVSPEPAPATAPPSDRMNLVIRIRNRGKDPVHICRAEGSGSAEKINRALPAGESTDLRLENVNRPLVESNPPGAGSSSPAPPRTLLPEVHLWIRAVRNMDLIVPRSRGTIRHGAENIGRFDMKYLIKRVVTP